MKELFLLMQNVLSSDIPITEDVIPDNIKTWDSLKHLQVMHAIEERYNIFFDPHEIDLCTEGVSRIIELLEMKGVTLISV